MHALLVVSRPSTRRKLKKYHLRRIYGKIIKDSARSKCCKVRSFPKRVSISFFRSALALHRTGGGSHYTHSPLATLPRLKLGIIVMSRTMSGPSHFCLPSFGFFLAAVSSTLSRSSISPQGFVSCFRSASSPFIVTQEHLLAMFNQELHRPVLGLRILHFPRQTLWPHDSRCENNRHVLARHQVVRLLVHDPR